MNLELDKKHSNTIVKWLLRSINEPLIKRYILDDAFRFCAFFAALDDKVVWPKSFKTLLDKNFYNENVELNQDKYQQWIESKSFPFSRNTNQKYLESFWKGVNIYSSVRDNSKVFDSAINSLLKKWNEKNQEADNTIEENKADAVLRTNIAHMNEPLMKVNDKINSIDYKSSDVPDYLSLTQFNSHLLIMQSFMKFTKTDMNLLEMSYLLCGHDDFKIFYNCFTEKYLSKILISSMLNINSEEYEDILSDESEVIISGLVSIDKGTGKPQEMSTFWYEWFSIPVGSFTELFAKVAKPMNKKYNSGSLGHISKEDKKIINHILLSIDQRTGSHILFYSPSKIDKLGFVYDLLKENKITAYEMNANIPPLDSPSACYFAQRYIHMSDAFGVLIIPRAENVLKKSVKSLKEMLFFAVEIEDEVEESLIEKSLLSYPMKMIWLTNNTNNLRDDTIGRFLYSCEVKGASRSERKQEIDKVLESFNLSDEFKNKLSQHTDLGEQQLRSAVHLSEILSIPSVSIEKLIKLKNDPDYIFELMDEIKELKDQDEILSSVEYKEKIILKAIEQSEKALNRKGRESLRSSITKYSLDYLNLSGGLPIEEIIHSLKINPHSSLCFFGLPGTGKTQLAEHIAVEIDKPIMIRTASDILGKYVGETEKAIKKIFQDASDEDAILLLDEGDSFLRDRSYAKNNWEVSMVNQLLQEMERFNGVFICATNLFKDLDIAALRRFTFKVEFLPLLPDQKWEMFVNEVDLKSYVLPDHKLKDMRNDLDVMVNLTPGDFATIKRQTKILGKTLSPEKWIEQLKFEVDNKMKALNKENEIRTRGDLM